MTLTELQACLAERRARLYVDLRGPVWDVTVTCVAHLSKRIAQATADELEDAVDMALMRYDAAGWK